VGAKISGTQQKAQIHKTLDLVNQSWDRTIEADRATEMNTSRNTTAGSQPQNQARSGLTSA